jgi:hypothetical protein
VNAKRNYDTTSEFLVKPSRSTFKLDHKGKTHSNLDYTETRHHRQKKHSLVELDAKEELNNYRQGNVYE